MKKILKILGKYIFIPLARFYLRKDRNYSYKGIKIKVLKGVFHPGLYFSTKVLLNYLSNFEFVDNQFLELGAGTGLISIFAAKNGAITSASDFSPLAIKNLLLNNKLNNLSIQIIESDLFDNFPPKLFDIIAIQPPFYPKDAESIEELAWFCGSDFKFFRKLFKQIGNFTNSSGKIIMILSDDCKIDFISQIANENGFEMLPVFEKKVMWEWNYIFRIKKKNE
jgi:release factor glutamine methyltransferase